MGKIHTLDGKQIPISDIESVVIDAEILDGAVGEKTIGDSIVFVETKDGLRHEFKRGSDAECEGYATEPLKAIALSTPADYDEIISNLRRNEAEEIARIRAEYAEEIAHYERFAKGHISDLAVRIERGETIFNSQPNRVTK